MERYHAMESLAPRDVVARAIDNEMKRTGDDFVFLDMTTSTANFVVERFPDIHAGACARDRHAQAADPGGAVSRLVLSLNIGAPIGARRAELPLS